MKKSITFAAAFIFICLLSVMRVSSQTPPTESWMRVQSDDGEFSIEVPENYVFFKDINGFTVSNDHEELPVRDMRMLTSLDAESVLCFEIYKAERGALQAMLARDGRRTGSISSQIDRPGYKLNESVQATDKAYVRRLYFYSKNNIYILTAASKGSETPAMRRFMESMKFDPAGKLSREPGSKLVSSLNVSNIGLTLDAKKVDPRIWAAAEGRGKTAAKDDSKSNLTILRNEWPSYTNDARQRGITGKIVLLVTFSSNGTVSGMAVKESLPAGLLRQAIFSAIRMKFLPVMKDGKPITDSRMVEYTFSIY